MKLDASLRSKSPERTDSFRTKSRSSKSDSVPLNPPYKPTPLLSASDSVRSPEMEGRYKPEATHTSSPDCAAERPSASCWNASDHDAPLFAPVASALTYMIRADAEAGIKTASVNRATKYDLHMGR